MRLRGRLVLSLAVLSAGLILKLKPSVLLPDLGTPVREKVRRETAVSQVSCQLGKDEL